jgi:hypothetical protein
MTTSWSGGGRAFGHSPIHHGIGQPPGRLPAFQEGKQLSLAWLHPDELAGAWVRYRPTRVGAIPLPPWVKKPIGDMNDFLLDEHVQPQCYTCAGRPRETCGHGGWGQPPALQVFVAGVRGHLIALAGMDPEPEKFTSWGEVRYTTLFIETSEARTRLRPKFAKIRPTAWDRVSGDE